LIREIDSDVDGKSISKHVVKDFSFSSNTLFLATGKYPLIYPRFMVTYLTLS
jgi:hypothetical protein